MSSTRVDILLKIIVLFFILFPFAGCGGGDGGDGGEDPGGGGEAALTIVSTMPSNGALGVERDVQIDITFSQAIDPGSLTDGTVTLTTGGISIHAGVSLNDTGTILRLSPVSPLAAGVTYRVTVSTAARDLEGNPLGSDFTFSFTTVNIPALSQRTKASAGRDNRRALDERGTFRA